MRKPKFFKKSLSFFLAFLMLLSSITVGFTAFAGTDKTWDLDSFVVDGTDIGKYLVEVARSFYDDAMAGGGINAEYGTADWRNYANLDVNGSPGGKARGTLIKDVTPEGNTYKAIKNAWEAIMRNTDVQNSDIPNKMRDYLKNALRDKMNPAGDYAASNAWEYCMESFFGYAHCTGKTSTSEHWVNGKSNTKSYNVVLTLSPEYYLWNAYGDDLANLPDNGVLPTHKCWWWINSNGSIVAAGKRANKGATKYDRDLFATYVRAKELKDFNTFIGEDFQTLKDGYNQYKSNGNSFNGMNQSDIAFSKLSQDRQIELLQKTIDNMNAIRNGTRQDTENGMPKTTLAHIVNDGADRAYPEVVIDGKKVEGAYIDISQADTDKVYKHFFGEYSDMENYVTALQQYMLMQFKNAVNAVKTNLYNDGDTSKGVNSDLTISELQDIKKNNIEFAEDIWVALPKALQDLLGTERTALNNYKADFIKLWNKRIGEAYISEVDELDKAVVGYPANFGQEGYIKLTDTGLRPAFVKSKLDAAADYRKQLLKADFTPTTVFGNAPGITGTTFLNDMNAAETNYNYVLEKYNRYLYEDFITAAKKIDPNAYTVQNGNPVAKDAGLDFFTKATANSRAKAALKKYKLLTNSYKNYDEAPFYFKVASLVWSIQGYEQYKMPAPTHMNWDDLGKANGSTKPITDLIERLSDFVSDPEMNQAVLGFKLNKRDLGNLLTEMGPDLVNGLMEFLYPFVKKALQDIVIDTELIGMKLKSTAYDMTVTGSFLSGPLGINISVKLSGLVPTPKLMGADSEMKNFSTNASVLSSYGENWEDVDWSKMDWKIGGTSADDSVYLTEVTTSLGNALAAALHGALKIVDAILKGQDAYLDVSAVGIDASNIDAVKKQTFVCKGSEGYETLVLPILEFLDCQGIVNTETFKGHDFKTSLNDILVPLVNKVADILENNTFDQIAKLLPNLAYVLEYGIINNMLHSIDASIAGQDGGRLDLGLWSNILKTDAIDSDFVNTKISELVPADLGLVIPEISFLQLGHLAAQIDTKSSIRTTNGGKRNWLNVPAEKALTWIVYYIDELLLENEDFFTDLVSANANISPDAKFDVMALILDLLGGTFDGLENASDFAADFYQLFTAYTPDKFNWVQTVNGWKWQKNTVDYSKVTDLYTKADVENFISQLNGILNNILPNLFKAEKGDTIRDFLNEQLYSSRRADELFNTFYRIFGSEALQKIYTLGRITIDGNVHAPIDATPDALWTALPSEFQQVRDILDGVNAYFAYDDSTNQPLYDVYGMRQHDTYDLKYEVDGKESNIKVLDKDGKPIQMEYEGSFIITKKVAIASEDGKSYTLEEREVYNCFNEATYVGKIIDSDKDADDPTNLSTTDTWNINGNSDKLRRAVTALLKPFNDFATVLLAGQTSNESNVKLVGAVYLKGNNGYEKALMPLFQALHFPNILSADSFNAAPAAAMQNVIEMVFEYLNALAEDPVGTLINAIPSIAFFIDNGGIQMMVENFLQPITNMITAITDVLQITSIKDVNDTFAFNMDKIGTFALEKVVKKIFEITEDITFEWHDIQHQLGAIINSIVPSIKLDKKDADGNKIPVIDEETGEPAVDKKGEPIYEKEEFNITIPEIPWGKIAGCGSARIADKAQIKDASGADAIVTSIRFVWDDVVRGANQQAVEGILTNLLGEDIYGLIEDNVDIFGAKKEPLTGDHIVQLLCALAKTMDTSAFGATGTKIQKIVKTVVTTDPNQVKDYVIAKSDVTYPIDPKTADATDPQNYTENDVIRFIQVLTNIVTSVLENYLDLSLSGIADDSIYTSAIVSSIAGAVYPLFDNGSVGSILGMIGVDSVDIKSLRETLSKAGYKKLVENVIDVPITAGEGFTPAAYPGDPTITDETDHVNWVYTAQLDADGQPVQVDKKDDQGNVVKDKDGKEVKETVYEWANRFWAKDENGAYIYTDAAKTQHAMSYWIASKDNDGNIIKDNNGFIVYEKYTAEDETKDASHKEGNYKVRDKKLADINWNYCAQEKYFNIFAAPFDPDTETAEEYNERIKDARQALTKALTTVLTPFTPFVNFLLNAGSITVAGVAPLIGTHGYRNYVKPLLDMFYCKNVVSVETYEAQAKADPKTAISNVITPILSKLNEALSGKDAIGPVRILLAMVPDLANFVNMGGIQELVYELIYPFSSLLDTVLEILTRGSITSTLDAVIDVVLYGGIIGKKTEGDDKSVLQKVVEGIFGAKEDDRITWDNAHKKIFDLVEKVFSLLDIENISITSEKDKGEEIALKVVIKDIKLGDDTRDLELSIPRFDLGWVAGIGPGRYTNDAEKYDPYYKDAVKKRTDSFLVIMQYIWKIVQVNKDMLTNDDDGVLKSILGDAYETAIPFVNSILDNTRPVLKNGVTAAQLKNDSTKQTVIESANEIVAALVQFTENTDSSNHYADKKTGYGADADISKVTWDTFFGYTGYNKPEDHVISYPVIPEKVAGDAYNKENKYTETDIQTTITALTVIVQDALSNLLDTTVEGLVADALYTNDIVSAVSKIIFSLADNKTIVTVLDMFDADLSAEGICSSLKAYGYKELAEAIEAAVTDEDGELTGELSKLQWADVYEYWVTDKDGKIKYDSDNKPIIAKDTDEYKVIATNEDGTKKVKTPGLSHLWYVESLVADDQDDPTLFKAQVWANKTKGGNKVSSDSDITAGYRFTRALMVTLSPLSNLINVLFNAGTGEFFKGAISIKGTHGYRNAIKPLLDVLDCNTAVTPEAFQEDANGENGDSDYVFFNILNPIVAKLGELLNDPINEVLDIATNFAAFMDNGGVQKAVEELLYPITQMFGPIIKLATRGVEEINGTELQGTTIFDIVFSFIDLGENVGWNNLHKMIPNIIDNALKIRVLKDQVNDRYVKVHDRDKQVEDAQNKKPVKEYYYVSSEPRQKYEGKIKIDQDGNPVTNEEGNPVYELDAAGKVVPELKDGEIVYIFDSNNKPVYWTDEDNNIIYDDIDVIIDEKDLDKETTFITGIEINNRAYKLDILENAGLETLLSDLAYCMINAKALDKPATQNAGIATLAEGDDADTTPAISSDVKRRSDAFVDIYRALRGVINANRDNFISPLVEDVLPDATYNAVGDYVNNVLYTPNSEEDDNILITLIRVADELGEDFAFDVDKDAYGTYNKTTKKWTVSTDPNTWYNLLRITPDKVNEGEFTAASTQDNVDRALETLWDTVNLVITNIVFEDNEKFANIDNLKDFALANFMNNELLSTLAKSIFALADNETVSRAFNILQVTMNKEYIVDELEYYGYTELATAVKNFDGKLSEIPWFTTVKDEEGNDVKVPSTQFGQKWYVDAAEGDDENADFKAKVYETWKKNWLDKHKGQTFKETELDVVYRFSRALMVVLAPFSKLIEVLTTANVVQFGDADANISIQGSYGYTSAIKPLLDALACDTVSVEKYRADAEDDSNLAILNIIRPLIARVDTIMQIPTRGVLGTLARLANFINAGGIQKAIENLLRPLTVLLNPVIDLINDDFEGDQTGNLYDVIFNIIDTALLDRNSDGVGALTDNGITWDNFHADITKLLNAVIPTLYVTRYKDPVTNEERLYKATKTTTKNILGKPTDRYEIDVQAVDEDGNPIKDAQNNDVYNKERIAASNITTVPNGIIINDVAYSITIPENINGFLAKLAGCAGETDVDMGASGSLLPKDYLDNKAAYNSFQEYKQNNVYAKVAVTLLRFVWDAVQANVTDLIDPLLTNLVDGKLDLSKDGIDKAYTDFIRTYIMNDDNSIIDELLGKAKVTLNYDGSEFVDLVIGLINALDASDHKVTDWDDIITGDYTAGTVTYPTAPGATTPYTSNDVKNLVNVISNIAMAAVEAFLDLSTVGLADDNIYSSQFVVNIAKAVYPLFDSAAIQSVLQILGVERVNLEYLANRLDREGYDRTAELVRADITDADLEVDGHKVNWTTVEKKNADGDVLDVDGEVVTNRETQTPATIEVNRFWKTDEDGRYLYVDADPSYEVLDGKAHVMTYWIEDETEEGGFAFQKYTAEDEKKNPANKEGEYVLVGGEKVLAIRDKQFADINWDIAADNKFFKIYGDNSGLSMDSAKEYRKTLVKALSTLLYPLIDLVDFMLNSGELNIYGVAHLKGADGYQNAIYPLLQVMGCDADRNDLKTPAEYKAEADVDNGGSRLNLLTNILNPLFSRLNNILLGSEGNASSFGFGKVILNTLPNLAIFIENGGIQKLVGELIYPIGNIVDTLLGVISKNKTDLFNVVFDTFVSADALEPLHTNKDFKGTGLTDRIIEKLIVAVFNPTAKTDAAGKIDNDVLQWANVHDNIYKLASTFLKEDKDSDEPKLYLTVNDDGELEVHNIILSRTTKNDDGEEETTKYPLPVVKIPSINTLLDNLAKLGAPIPWSNIVDGEDLNDGNSAEGIQRRTDAFVDVWSFIWSIVENNFDKDATNTEDLFLNQLVDGFLKDLMGEDLFETASPYLKTVLSRDSGRVLTAFIQATNDLSVADINYDSTWDKYFAANNNDKGAVVYPIKNHKESTAEIDDEGNERYDSEDVNKILNGLSGIAQSVVSAITDKTISELSVDLIFTDNIVATIAQAICSIASNDVAKAFLPLLDIDLSFDTFIGKLREYGYSDLAREVQKYNVAGKDLADIKWFVQATDDSGKLMFNEDGSKVMVPSDLAKMFYIEDADAFIAKVWNDKSGGGSNADIKVEDINGQYRFTRALLAVIAPFSDLINTLFNAGTSEWFADVDEHDNIIPGTGFKVTGAHGYTNAVKPLMQALGLTSENGLMSTADFRQSVADNGNDYVFFNVVNPLLSRINNIIKSPGTELFGTIASLGAFIGDKEGAFTNKGNLQFAIEALLSPILSILDPIVDLADDEKQLTVFSLVFEILGIKHKGETKDKDIAVTWDNFHEHLFDVVAFFLKPNKEKPDNLYAETLESVMFIKNITINGVKYTLELPEYDLSKLKDCTVSDDIEKRSADAFVTIFRYIERILKENSVEKNKDGEFTSNLDETAFITKLIYNLVDGDNKDTYSVMKPYLQNVFGAKTDTLLITVIRVFANLSESVLDQLYPEIADVTEHWNEMLKLRDDLPNVNYADLALEEVTNAVGTVKESVQNALDAYAKDFDLENLTTTYIYKNSIPNLLANVIFPLSDNNLIESVLRIVGIDLSRDFIIKELQKSGYEELAALMIDADKRIEASDTDLKLADAMKLKIQAKDEDGNLLWNDAEKKDPKMIVNPDIEKLWYVEDADGFMENVWATGGNSSRDPETIDASYRFKRALITVLAPFREFLGVFFAYNTITIFNDPNEGHPDSHNVRLLGDRGYGNAIKPLLEALGFDAVPAETYLKNVAYDSDYILYGIIDPILARIDDILADPVGELLDTLNSLALYIGNGGLQESIKNLLNPLTKLLSPIVRLVLGEVVDDNQIDMRTMSGLYDLIIGFVAEFFDIEVLQLTDEQREEGFSIWENIHKWSYLREVIQRVLKLAKIEKITINGVDYPITIPAEGPFEKLAGCRNVDAKTQKAVDDAQKALDALKATGTATAAQLEAAEKALADAQATAAEEVRGNTLLTFIQYIWYVVEENEPKLVTPLLKNLLGDNYDKFSKYIERVLGKNGAEPEDISTAVVRFLNAIDSSDHEATGWDILKNNLTATEVKYPEDGSYTADSVNKAVQLLSNVITGVLETILETSVTELTTEKIYTNEIVNKIAGAIYPAVVGMESVLKLAGVDVSKDYVANIIGETYGYTDIAATINAVKPAEGKKWTDDIKWDTFDWKVDNNSDNFAHAIAAVLAPFNSLIDALLCSGEVNVASVVPIIGANGYKNALQPLLNELGFVTEGIIDEDAPTLEAIIKVVLHKIDDIVTNENLVGKVVDILPGLANFVANGGVQKFVEELIYPITNLVDPIFRLIADDEDQSIFDFAINLLADLDVIDLTAYGWKDVHTQIFTIVENLIGDGITINGTTYPLTIPENIEGLKGNIFNALAGCAVLGNGNANANSVPDTLVTLLRYVWAVVQQNSDKLVKPLVENLVGADTYSNVKKYLVNLLDVTTADEFVEAVIEVLNSIDHIDCNGVNWSDIYKNYVGSAVGYPIKGIKNIKAEVTADDVQDIINMVSGVADAVIPMVLKDYASLNDFVAEKLYTDNIANALAKVLLPLLENETIVKVLSVIGVDYSGETVAEIIETKLGNQTNILEMEADSIKDVDWSKVTWGIKDSASFAKVLAVLIEPFTPVVDFILNGKPLTIANDAAQVAGDNGYKNAVKQLLTVLGCDLDALNAIDDSASLEAIINIVLGRVEEILDSPVDEIVGMIAGLVNFVNNSGLQIMIEELVHPITNIVTPVVRLASDRVDGELTHASVFEIVFDVLKDKLNLDKDANWMNIQNYIFQIAEGFLKVNYVVVNGKNIAATKVTDKEDKNYGKFSYTVDGKTKYVDKAEQMNGIAIKGIAYPLTIPTKVNDVDLFEALANCGKLNGTNDAIIGNGPDTLVTVLRYVWAVVKANENTLIVPLLKDLLNADLYKNLEGYLTNLFDSTDDQVIVALVETLNKFKKDGHTADWSKVLEKTPVTVKYPDGLKAFDVTDAIYSLTNAINFVMPMVLEKSGYKSLSALVNGVLYKDNSLIVKIADALRGLGLNKDGSESDLNKTLKKIVNIDFTTVPTKVGKVKNSATFAKELAKVLAPFNEIVDAVLNGNSITIAAGILGDNAITIEGENAYVNAIKPLLEVLGCKTSGISDNKATLKDILTAVLARVDEILDSKNILNEILKMVPDIANFINNGGIQLFVDELIYPVIRIATPLADLLGIDSVFDLALSLIGVDFDWYDIQNNLFDIIASFLKPNDKKNNLYAEIKNGNLVLHNLAINGKKYNVTIPKFDLAKLAGATDKNGKVAEAAFITILRYVWNVVETNKNGFILPLLKSVLGDNYKKFGEYIEKVLANKGDVVIKALVDFLNGVDASTHKADWSFLIKNYKTANIKYPNGVTVKDLESVVEILSVAVNNALQIFLGKGLDDLVPGMIYNDSLIKTLANAMNSLKTNKGLKDVFKLLGVDFSKVNYNQKWNVTDKRSFAKALATILSPFNNVLATVLNAGEFNLEDIIDLTGANGYENAIKPLLDTLGCKTVSASRYKSDALKNSNNLLLDILNPLLDRVDEILANPIEEIVGLLPAVANFINQGGIQKFVEELFYPVLELVNPIVKLVTKDNVFDFALKLLKKLGVLDVNLTWKKLQNQIIPIANSFLTNIKINGKSYKITVPNIDWSILGGCGKVSKNAIVAKDGDILLTLLRYVFKVLDANKNIIFDLVGGKNSTIGTIVNNVLKQGADGMAKIVVRILLKLETFDNVKWTFKNIKELKTKYTEHLGEKDYLKAIGELDTMITNLLQNMLNISLESVLGDLVYTNNIINTVAKLIYTNIEKVNIGIDLNTVLKVVDLDVSTKGVASILKDYSAASKAIGGKAKWSDVNFDSINWGFQDGNRDGFVNALSAILRPVQPILRVVLSGEDLIVLGSIKIKGGNGYNTAIIPLLEALDINPGTLVSPQQYNKEASTDKVLTNILNPLLDKVEELTHGPIDTLTKILPNIAYFVYNGGIQDIAENLIAPVTNILHEIDPIYSLNLDLSMLGDVDLAGLVNGILAGIKIKGQPLGIVLPDIDLATLAGRGKLVTYRSARTYFGSQMDCKKINADQAAVFISVLRYIVKTLQDNLDNIKKLLEGLGLSGEIANTIAQVLDMLTTMDVDGVIEALLETLLGFKIGDDAPAESDGNANGLAFGSFSWFYTVYWVMFAVTVIIAMYFLSLLYGKKREDEETNPENPEA